MRLYSFKTVALIAVSGLLGVGIASPAAADGWGWGHGGWGGNGWGRRHYDDGGAAAAAALGGFALGAVVGATSQSGYGPAYEDCYFVERPVMDEWGGVVAYQRAQVCE